MVVATDEQQAERRTLRMSRSAQAATRYPLFRVSHCAPSGQYLDGSKIVRAAIKSAVSNPSVNRR
jgi:hypothetical protein